MSHYIGRPNRGNKYCCQIIIPMKYRSSPSRSQKGKVGRVLDGLIIPSLLSVFKDGEKDKKSCQGFSLLPRLANCKLEGGQFGGVFYR